MYFIEKLLYMVMTKICKQFAVFQFIYRHEESKKLSFYFFLFFKFSLLKIFCLGTLQEKKLQFCALGFQGIGPHDSVKRRSSACVSWCGGVVAGEGSCRNKRVAAFLCCNPPFLQFRAATSTLVTGHRKTTAVFDSSLSFLRSIYVSWGPKTCHYSLCLLRISIRKGDQNRKHAEGRVNQQSQEEKNPRNIFQKKWERARPHSQQKSNLYGNFKPR